MSKLCFKLPFISYIGKGIYKIVINSIFHTCSESYTIADKSVLFVDSQSDLINIDETCEYLIYTKKNDTLYLYTTNTFHSAYHARCQSAHVLCYKVKSIKHSSTLNLKLELELEPNAEEIASGLHIKHRERWLMSSVPHDSDAMAEDHVLYKTLYDFSMTSCTSCIECLPKATAKLSWFVGNTLVVLNAMIYSNISSTFLYIPSCPVDAITFKPRLYRKIAAGPYCCGAGSWFFYRVMYSSWIELSEINYIEAIKHEFCIKCQIRLPKWIDRQKDLLCGSYHCRPESRNTSIL